MLSRCYLQMKNRRINTKQNQAEVRQSLKFTVLILSCGKLTYTCPSLAETSICLNYSVCAALKLKNKKRLASKWKERISFQLLFIRQETAKSKSTERACRDPPNPKAHRSPGGSQGDPPPGGSPAWAWGSLLLPSPPNSFWEERLL